MNGVIKVDWTEQLFARRNRAYGSYVLRRTQERSTGAGFALSLLMMIGITVVAPELHAWLAPPVSEADVRPTRTVDYGKLAPPPDIDPARTPPPPLPAAPPPQRATLAFQAPVVRPDDLVANELTITAYDSLLNTTRVISHKTQDGSLTNGFDVIEGGDGENPVELSVEREIGPDEFVVVEQEPRPVNYDELKKQVGYPPLARDAGIQGDVVVRILVSKDGRYEKHVVLRSRHELLTKAVEAQLNQLRFTPGIQAGKPIRVWVTIPFRFKLN